MQAQPTNVFTNDIDIKGVASFNKHALLRYNLASIANQTISGATLTTYFKDVTPLDGQADLYNGTQSFVEAQATWNIYATGSNWTSAATHDRGSKLVTASWTGKATNDPVTWNSAALTTYVQNAVNGSGNPANKASFIFMDDAQANKEYIFRSQNGTDGFRPTLAVTISVPANTYQVALASSPTAAVLLNGVSLTQATTLSGMADNQWYWLKSILYVRSSAGNPDSVGAVVETTGAGTRSYAIFVNQVDYITLNNLEVEYASTENIYLRDSSYDVLQNMKIHDSQGQGIYAGIGGGGFTIENNEIYNTGLGSTFGGGSGIQLNGVAAPPVTLPSVIQNNYIHDIGTSAGGNHGVYSEVAGDTIRYNSFYNITSSSAIKVDATGVLIYNNLFNTIPIGGIYIDPYSGVKVYNNTFYNAGTASPFAAILFVGDGGQTGVEAKNNVVYVSSGYSVGIIVQTNATGFSSDYNGVFGALFGEWSDAAQYTALADWTNATGQDVHSFNADPKFTTTGSNFSLLSTSPAIDTGANLGSTYQLGLVPGSSWPSAVSTLNQNNNGLGWDIGAYVYTESTLPTVSLTAPASGATVSDAAVSLSATASDNSAVAGVQFKLDTNTNIGAEDTDGSYGVAWDSTAVADGTHTLIAVARDTYGNYATSTAVTVTVDNTAPVITLSGASTITQYAGQMFTDPGATATDDVDGSVSVTTGGSVNTAVVGTYTLTYNATDAAGNIATQVTRTVVIQNVGNGAPVGLINTFGTGPRAIIPTVPEVTTTSQTTPVAQTSAFVFTRDLDIGAKGEDVRQLQIFLNTHGFSVAAAGPGSADNETTYFGLATQAALAKYQAANSITPAVGYFGPKTRVSISGSTTQSATPSTPPNATAPSTVFTRDLELGNTGEDVRALQQYLNAHGFQLANYGVGSPGNETDYFGNATQYQLIQLQKQNGITPAVGYFGPKTRAVIKQAL